MSCTAFLIVLARIVHHGYNQLTRGRDRQYLRILEFQSFQVLAKLTREVTRDVMSGDSDIVISGPKQVCCTRVHRNFSSVSVTFIVTIFTGL